MTIAIGALAEGSKAIICVADKAVTYNQQIQWDADVTKIVLLDNKKLIAMFSGGEESVSRILGKIAEKLSGFSPAQIRECAESAYGESLSELIEADVLSPRGLDWDKYCAATSGPKINRYMESVASAIDAYRIDCDFLLCGFYDDRQPFIGHLRYPGVFTNMARDGMHAIGAGGQYAINRLLYSESKRTQSMGRVLYDTVYAKYTSEMAIGVGYETDASINTVDSASFVVPSTVMDLITNAYAKQERSPFEKRNPKEDRPNPPRDWIKRVEQELSNLSKPS
jgi:ATP-dependent protease HslVU (ClpYQ) peptidase subunit